MNHGARAAPPPVGYRGAVPARATREPTNGMPAGPRRRARGLISSDRAGIITHHGGLSMKGRRFPRFLRRSVVPTLAALGLLLAVSCSLKEMATDTVIDALAGGSSSAFTSDTDPKLVGDALPFALKLYETLIEQSPEHEGLLLTTGSAFVMYSNGYVQMPADMLPEDRYDERGAMRARAKALYLRGRDYVLRGLDVRHPGIVDSLRRDDSEAALERTEVEDVPYLYWAGAGWMAAIAIHPFDVELGITRERALALLLRALELDEAYSDGAIHEVLISYYGSMPPMLGGSEEKARRHFERAVEISDGGKPGPYVALAQSVAVKNQDYDEFVALLEEALAIETSDPDSALLNTMLQNKARWLLEHADNFFLLD